MHYAVDGPSPPTTTPEESSTGTSTSTSQRGTPPLEIWLRVIPGREYIKLTVLRGKIVGALLIGDTDLEETCENLILNALDVGGIGIGMLDPSVDIEDYFD